ncbi:hypothetical protein C8R42DRAFT_726406 [Lentinula raphanica]|nr:hypothetical protein C8R42DRAFT_726406 [Lentinula raphanica]
MPRTRKSLPHASTAFQVKGFHISALNTTTPANIFTLSTRPPRCQGVICVPLVESVFEGWPVPQSYIHDIDVIYRRSWYRIFFQRHKSLRRNPVLRIRGDLVVMRVGSMNTDNVVNPRAGDSVHIRALSKRFAPHLTRFQSGAHQRIKPIINL